MLTTYHLLDKLRPMTFLNEKLVDLRWEKRLKQKDLAALIGIDPAVLSHWESGKRIPSATNLMLLSAALGVEPCYFFAPEYHQIDNKEAA